MDTQTNASVADKQGAQIPSPRDRLSWGPLILFAVVIAFSAWYVRSPTVQERYHYFIVLVSVITTVFYSFVFLIAPEFQTGRGLSRCGAWLLAILLFISLVVSAILISIYVDLTFSTRSVENLYVNEAFVGAFNPLFSGSENNISHTVRLFVSGLVEAHFFIFVFVFFLIDVVFVLYSPKPEERVRFRRVCLIIDVPILIAVLVTLLAKHVVREDGEFFQAGAISFQFITGTIAAYMLDNEPALTSLPGRARASLAAAGASVRSVLPRRTNT